MADQQTSYDRLFVVRVFFFVSLIMLANLAYVTLAYSFLIEKPFHTVLAKEREKFEGFLTPQLSDGVRFTGDKLYDGMFVKSGLEQKVYLELKEQNNKDVAGNVARRLKLFSSIIDNTFDYLLLLSYRTGFFGMAMSYFAFLILAVTVHGAVVRHRKRYEFGDTPIMMNLWARASLAYSIPITFFIWTIPHALNPAILGLSLTVCVFSLAIFVFSMPKIA